MSVRLNVGCGTDYRKGFVNIDGSEALHNVDKVVDISTESLLSHFSKGEVEYILAGDIVEHLFRWEAITLLKDFYDLLIIGGQVEIRVPDVEYIINNGRFSLEKKMNLLYGGQDIPQGRDFKMDASRRRFPKFFCHKYGWTMKTLEDELHNVGFSTVTCKRAGANFIAYATKLEQRSASHTTADGSKSPASVLASTIGELTPIGNENKLGFWPQLEHRLHVRDQPSPASWRLCYETKHALAALLKPYNILEIGVRAGYSAFSFLTACPHVRYLGVDNNSNTHGGFRGSIEHARLILQPFDVKILELPSGELAKHFEGYEIPPAFDLVHVDGDHSMAGCYADLLLALQCHPRAILVDDYTAIPEVKKACDQFFGDNREQFHQLKITDGHNGAILFLRNECVQIQGK